MEPSPDTPMLVETKTYSAVVQEDAEEDSSPSVASTSSSPRRNTNQRPDSFSSTASTTVYDKRLSSASLNTLGRRHRKPLAGDRFLKIISRTPLILKIFFLIVLTGLPFGAFTGLAYTTFANSLIGEHELHVTYKDLSIFLDTGWAAFLIILALAECCGRFFSWVSHSSVRTAKYAPLADTMWFRLTMIAWIGVMHQAACMIWPIAMEDGHVRNWVFQLRLVLEFLTAAAGIFLVQGILLQLIAVQYVQGYIGPRSQRAVDELETLRRLNDLLVPRRTRDKSKFIAKLLRKIFLPPKSDVFDQIREGRCGVEEVSGYAAVLWATVAGSKPVITISDMYERLLSLRRDPGGAGDLFLLLDRSHDHSVSREEFEQLVLRTAGQLRKQAAAMTGITLLLRKLEILLCLIVAAFIVFLYSKLCQTSSSSHANYVQLCSSKRRLQKTLALFSRASWHCHSRFLAPSPSLSTRACGCLPDIPMMLVTSSRSWTERWKFGASF
jgi:hypothetical protein